MGRPRLADRVWPDGATLNGAGDGPAAVRRVLARPGRLPAAVNDECDRHGLPGDLLAVPCTGAYHHSGTRPSTLRQPYRRANIALATLAAGPRR